MEWTWPNRPSLSLMVLLAPARVNKIVAAAILVDQKAR